MITDGKNYVPFYFFSLNISFNNTIQSFLCFCREKNIFIGGNCNGRITVSDNSSYDFSNVKIVLQSGI